MPLRRLINHRLARFGRKMSSQDQEPIRPRRRRTTVRLSSRIVGNRMPSSRRPSRARTSSQHPNGFNSARKPILDLGNSKNHCNSAPFSRKDQSRKVQARSRIVCSSICRRAEYTSTKIAMLACWQLVRKTLLITGIAFLSLAI